jgi:hypothetical protein
MGKPIRLTMLYYGVVIIIRLFLIISLVLLLWQCPMNIRSYVTSNPIETTIWVRKGIFAIGNIGTFRLGLNNILK